MPHFLIAPLIGLAGTIGSSLLNRHHGSGVGGSTPLLPPGLDQNALLSTLGQQKDLAGFLTGTGKDTLAKGSSTLDKPLDFYNAILGGDRTALMQTLAPEVAQVNAQFRQPLQEAALTGRGSALTPDLEASKQSAISNLFFKERPAAADKLTSIAQGLMNLGTGQVQAGGGILSDASHEILDYNSIIRGIQASQSGQSAGLWGALGSSLGPILATILKGAGGGGGGSSSGGGSTAPIPFPSGGGAEGKGSAMTFDPAVIASLLNQNTKPDPYAGWLETMGEGLRPR